MLRSSSSSSHFFSLSGWDCLTTAAGVSQWAKERNSMAELVSISHFRPLFLGYFSSLSPSLAQLSWMFCAWTCCHWCIPHTRVKIVFLRQLERHLAFMQSDRHAVLVWIRSCFTCCSRAAAWKSVAFCQVCNWFNLTLPSLSSWHGLLASWMVRRELLRFLLVSAGERRIQTKGML